MLFIFAIFLVFSGICFSLLTRGDRCLIFSLGPRTSKRFSTAWDDSAKARGDLRTGNEMIDLEMVQKTG